MSRWEIMLLFQNVIGYVLLLGTIVVAVLIVGIFVNFLDLVKFDGAIYRMRQQIWDRIFWKSNIFRPIRKKLINWRLKRK